MTEQEDEDRARGRQNRGWGNRGWGVGDDRARGRGQCRGMDRAGGTVTEQEDDDSKRTTEQRDDDRASDRTGGR